MVLVIQGTAQDAKAYLPARFPPLFLKVADQVVRQVLHRLPARTGNLVADACLHCPIEISFKGGTCWKLRLGDILTRLVGLRPAWQRQSLSTS